MGMINNIGESGQNDVIVGEGLESTLLNLVGQMATLTCDLLARIVQLVVEVRLAKINDGLKHLTDTVS